jgi:hypothetical protein
LSDSKSSKKVEKLIDFEVSVTNATGTDDGSLTVACTGEKVLIAVEKAIEPAIKKFVIAGLLLIIDDLILYDPHIS